MLGRRLVPALALLVGYGASERLAAQERGLLADLTSVNLRVRLEGAAATYPGLDPAALRSSIQYRLRLAAIGVDDVDSSANRGQSPVLTVLLIMYADSSRLRAYAFSLTVTLTEGVTTRRGSGERIWADTWTAGSTVGILGADGVALIQADVDEMVERFVREYRKANEKSPYLYGNERRS